MTVALPLKNDKKKVVTIDQHVHEALLADERLTKIKLLDNLRRHSNGYAFFQRGTTKDGKLDHETIYLHKLIAERYIKKPKSDLALFVRFKDGDVRNATLENLEWVTMAALRRHMNGKGSTTGYRGVTKERAKYRAVLYDAGTTHNLGMFDTAAKAAEAYNKKSRELFGETGSLNVIRKEN